MQVRPSPAPNPRADASGCGAVAAWRSWVGRRRTSTPAALALPRPGASPTDLERLSPRLQTRATGPANQILGGGGCLGQCSVDPRGGTGWYLHLGPPLPTLHASPRRPLPTSRREHVSPLPLQYRRINAMGTTLCPCAAASHSGRFWSIFDRNGLFSENAQKRLKTAV